MNIIKIFVVYYSDIYNLCTNDSASLEPCWLSHFALKTQSASLLTNTVNKHESHYVSPLQHFFTCQVSDDILFSQGFLLNFLFDLMSSLADYLLQK